MPGETDQKGSPKARLSTCFASRRKDELCIRMVMHNQRSPLLKKLGLFRPIGSLAPKIVARKNSKLKVIQRVTYGYKCISINTGP
jgi:hypothetical protein